MCICLYEMNLAATISAPCVLGVEKKAYDKVGFDLDTSLSVSFRYYEYARDYCLMLGTE